MNNKEQLQQIANERGWQIWNDHSVICFGETDFNAIKSAADAHDMDIVLIRVRDGSHQFTIVEKGYYGLIDMAEFIESREDGEVFYSYDDFLDVYSDDDDLQTYADLTAKLKNKTLSDDKFIFADLAHPRNYNIYNRYESHVYYDSNLYAIALIDR